MPSPTANKIPFNQRRWLAGFAIGMYLLLVALSAACLVIRREGLAFHTRDYNYFIEQAARLTDPQMSKRFALNIEGFNFIGQQGIEGANSLIQAIHTEYFRYSYVVLYGLFHSTLVIYLFYSLVYFTPLLYIALVPNRRKETIWQQVVFFIVLFIFIPSTMTSVTNDLRPRMLYGAAWCMAVLAVYFDRPFLEKLVLFGFLLAIREEGILLGAVIIGLNFLSMRGKSGSWKQTLVFLFFDLLAAVLFAAFMIWGKYTRIDAGMNPLSVLPKLSPALPVIILIAILIVLGLFWTWIKQRQSFSYLLLFLIYCLAIAMTGFQAIRDSLQWAVSQQGPEPVSSFMVLLHTLTYGSNALFFYTVVLLLVILLDFTRRRVHHLFVGGLTALTILFAAISLATFPVQVAAWYQNIPAAKLVWQFVDSHDRYQTNVLLDYSTYQAFYAYDKVLVYNRLPMWLVNPVPENRFYPQNQALLVKQIQERMQYAVISRESLPTMQDLARQAGISTEELASNNHFVILRLR